MRRINFKFAVASPQLEAFVFFCLALDEQLYDLTEDSYKAPALNTYTRTLELQTIANANHAAGISKEALKPFIEELEWSVSRDNALNHEQRALAKVYLDDLKNQLGESDRIARSVSGLRIVFGDYMSHIKSAIATTIREKPNAKQSILELAAALIIQAELHGLPRRHTYHVAQNTLIRPLKYESSISHETLLENFFTKLELKGKEHSCLFLAEGHLDKYKKLLSAYSFQILTTAPQWGGLRVEHALFLDSKRADQKFLRIDKLRSASAAGVHEIATAMFDEFESVVRHEDHLARFEISKLALIRVDDSGELYITRQPPDPMHCWTGSIQRDQKDILILIEAIHKQHLYPESALRFKRAITFHKTALQANSPENQLIDLWAALEGLLPPPAKDGVRIEHFSETLLPTLTLTYPEKLFTSAYRDVIKVTTGIRPVIAKVKDGTSQFSKFVRLVLCPEESATRDEAIHLLKSHPLLLNKVWKLSEAFKSRTATQDTLRTHRRRLKWHLARIYFTRNSIMHSATTLPHLRTLVENLHFYVDTLIRSLAVVAKASPETLSVEGAMKYLATWEKYRLEHITSGASDNGQPLTSSEVWSVVFGKEMALAPSEEDEVIVKI